jgi:hypothetical protein
MATRKNLFQQPAKGGISWGFNAGDTGFCIARGVRD